MIQLKTILLVDDNSSDVELAIEALSEHKLADAVVVMNDGAEALEYLRYQGKYQGHQHSVPAVILLDIKMPKMDGIEVLKEIRSDQILKTIPVVMLTSSREEPDLRICYELGVNAYVVKPVNYDDFIMAIKQVGLFWATINETPPEVLIPDKIH